MFNDSLMTVIFIGSYVVSPDIYWFETIGKILLTSPIVINVPTRASLAVETKDLLFLWLAYLNKKSNVCKQISSLYT